MSEIEKMYRAAKVVPSHHYCNDCKYDMSAECPIRCPDDVAVYPPFTAEKQLLLIQWLLNRADLYLHKHKSDFTYSIASGNYAVNKYRNLEKSIAEFINAIWQDLTEEEKQQVKGILE